MEDQEQIQSPAPPESTKKLYELELDWEALAVAFENQLRESHSFLNLKTGKVHTIICEPEKIPSPPDPAEDYLYLQPRPSREGYRTMQNFIDQTNIPSLKERLTAALVGKGAFRRFKDQLLNYPELRQQWFIHKDREVYAYVRSWLSQEGIIPINEPPEPTVKPPAPGMGMLGTDTSLGHRREIVAHPLPEIDNSEWQKEISGYNREEIRFQPSKTALLVIDMQRVFVEPEGSSYLPMAENACKSLLALIDACRQASVPVIFTRHVHLDPRQDGGAMARWWQSLILEGSRDSELSEQFQIKAHERVITKCRYSAFVGTPLEMILHSLGIEDLLIGGVMTNLCCETTARDAFVKDFNVFFLGDGTATLNPALQKATLQNIAYGFGRVLSVAQALECLGLS